MLSRTLVRMSWIALIGVLAFTSSAMARDAHSHLRGFYPTGEFDLVVGGKKADAEILFSRAAAAYLITPTGGERQYLVAQRDRKVSLVHGAVIRQKNGDVDLPKNVVLKAIGSAMLKEGDIIIDAGPLQGRLTPRPPALGRLSGAALLAHSPHYGLVMRGYKLDMAAVRQLKEAKAVVVEAFFGSWCPRCQQSLGNMLALERQLQGSGVSFTYYGLPAPPAAWKEARYLQAQIKGLPAALVFVNGVVVGRLGSGSWQHLESSIAALVKGS